MNDIRIDGKGTIAGGEYGAIKVNGFAQSEGDVRAASVDVDGTMNCRGSLTADLLDCDGAMKIEADLRVKKMMVDGMLRVTSGREIEAEELFCDGSLHIDGQISADKMVVNGLIRAREIVGDQITISSSVGRLARLFIHNGSKADLIEATTIRLSGVTAKAVNGQDIVVGPFCEIDSLDCSGTLSVDPTATSQRATGSFVRNDR